MKELFMYQLQSMYSFQVPQEVFLFLLVLDHVKTVAFSEPFKLDLVFVSH